MRMIHKKFLQIVIWAMFWVLPLMLAIVWMTTVFQIKWASVGNGIPGHLLAIFVSFVLGYWLQIPFVRMVVDREQGKQTGFAGSILETLRLLPTVSVSGTLLFIGVFSGIVLLVVPGIWMLVTYSLFVQSAVCERRPGIGSLRSAGIIVKGFRLSVTLILVMLVLAELAVQSFVAVMMFLVEPSVDYGVICQVTVHSFFIPLQAIVLSFLYRNLMRMKYIEKSI